MGLLCMKVYTVYAYECETINFFLHFSCPNRSFYVCYVENVEWDYYVWKYILCMHISVKLLIFSLFLFPNLSFYVYYVENVEKDE